MQRVDHLAVVSSDPSNSRSLDEDTSGPDTSLFTDTPSTQAMDQDPVPAASEDSTTDPQPSSPSRVSANIGKRRSKGLSLARSTTSPGHSVKMARIYQAAKTSLRSPRSPSGLRTPNLNRLRISLGEETHVPCSPMDTDESLPENPSSLSGATGGEIPTTPPCPSRSEIASVEASHASIRGLGFIAQEPMSSGFSSAISSSIRYPALKTEESPVLTSQLHDQSPEKSSWPSNGSESTDDDHDGEDQYLLFYGVPLPEPMTERQLFGSKKGKRTQRADTWLDELFEDNMGTDGEDQSMGVRTKSEKSSRTPSPEKGLDKRIHRTKETEYQPGKASRPRLKRLARSDSDKENRRPTDPGSSPVSQSPQRDFRRVRLGAGRPVLGTPSHSSPGKGKLGSLPNVSATRFQPLKRPGKSSSPETTTPRVQVKVESGPSATPQHVNMDSMDVPLTPDVEIYRKGNRPKRARCPSYFDEDIFQDVPDHPTTSDPGESDEAQHSPVHSDGRKILGESVGQTHLTKPQAFCKEAEDYDFKGL